MFENNAIKIYNRLDNVLKKDKALKSDEKLNENLKNDIEKTISSYLEIKPSTSSIKIEVEQNEMFLQYFVKVKRIKDFIFY